VSARTVYRQAETTADMQHVMRLRDLVYVQDQGRLASASDMSKTFDRFDGHAAYFLAEINGEPVGTIKVVDDSPLGLPCEAVVDIDEFRSGHHLIELGHLMTDPRIRGQRVGLGLMRSGLVHAVRQFGATRLVGDFFAEGPYVNLGSDLAIPPAFIREQAENAYHRFAAMGQSVSRARIYDRVASHYHDHHGDELVAEMDAAGVDQAVLVVPDFSHVAETAWELCCCSALKIHLG
jgi:GNAT superfamily N-acetyltransferase